MNENIVKAIPLEDVFEFVMTEFPTKEWLRIIYSYGFNLTKIYICNDYEYYTFTKMADVTFASLI